MAYNNLESRTDLQALMPEDVSNAILTGVVNESAALTMFRHVTMARGQTRLPVLSALPVAYFVTGDTGLKQTTEANWANKYLNAEEIACIIPIPDAVLEDTDMDAWAETIPFAQQAIGRTLDAAVFFGTNKPASWPLDIVSGAAAVVPSAFGVARGTSAAAAGGVYGDVSAAMALVEGVGYDVNGIIAQTTWKGYLRNARSTQGVKLDDAFALEVADLIKYPMRGLWPTASGTADAIVGDFTQGILGIRRDITIDRSQEAIIQDNTGAIVYNAFQQDMTLVRLTARFAFQVANIINWDQVDSTKRYPFSVITKP